MLRLSCRYTSQIAGGEGPKREVFPVRLHVYGTHELRRDRPSLAVRLERDGAFEATIEWRGEQCYAPLARLGAYSFKALRKAEPGKISRAARIVFNAYASTLNDELMPCWSRVGSTNVTLEQLGRLLRGDPMRLALVQNAIDVDPLHSGEDVVRTDEALIKGFISIDEARFDGDLEAALLPEQTSFDMASAANLRRASLEMNNVINRLMAQFFGPTAALPRATISPLIRFHAPVSQRDQLVMASLGYPMNRSRPAEHLEAAIAIVCWRRDLSPAALADTARRLFAGRVPRATAYAFYSFCAAVIALLANSLAYLDDFANRNKQGEPWQAALVEGDEDNKCARTELADDCEGLALECLMIAMDLFDGVEGSELLGWIGRVVRLYVPGQMFGAVTNAKMVYGDVLTRDTTLAHTYCALIPFERFDAMLTPDARAKLAKTRAYQSYARVSLDLPILVLEGTATIDATMLPIDDYYTDADELATAMALCATRSQFTNDLHAALGTARLQTEMLAVERRATLRDLSAFYKWVNGFTTPVFAESRLLDFAFYYDAGMTYGVRFNDLLLASNYRLMPTVELSEREAAVLDNVLALDETVPRILAPEGTIGRDLGLTIRRRAPSPSTAFHKPRVLVTGRAADIGPDEIAALQRIAALRDWAAIETRWHRVARVDLPHLEPIDILDVVYVY